MSHEQSYGIIPLRQTDGQWEVLLVQHSVGHWAFPKGHPEAKETQQEAASRELKEETGLEIEEFLPFASLSESYYFFSAGKRIHKTVIYFAAKVTGIICIQTTEIRDAKWLPIDQAIEQVTFPQAKNLCQQICNQLH